MSREFLATCRGGEHSIDLPAGVTGGLAELFQQHKLPLLLLTEERFRVGLEVLQFFGTQVFAGQHENRNHSQPPLGFHFVSART